MSKAAFEVAIVGAGVAGSALARSLAGAGKPVVVLEQSLEFEDRVRGEWLAPWGVLEARELGLLDALRSRGGHFLSRHVGYDELLPPEVAEANAIDLSIFCDAPGPLAIEHVEMQRELLRLAEKSGAEIRRGVRRVELAAGPEPRVSFEDGDGSGEIHCRLIVGADGRSSTVRRQLGIALHEDPIDHLIAGLLVEGLDDWPETQQSIGKVGDIQHLIFPQGAGRARLYADYDAAGRGRFSGPDGSRAFLACFDTPAIPGSEEIARATPIGPCRSYPSQDAWTDSPVAAGALLVGDAAGYNDPIIGQGLSIAFRDVRIVRDLLLGNEDWRPESFQPYVRERAERLRRLRLTAQLATRLGARFDPASVEARQRAMARLAEHPEIFPLAGALAGPENIPDVVLKDGYPDELFA